MNNVLLTGGAGFVGSHCLEYWLDKTDWNFLIIDSFRHKGTYSRLDAIPNLDLKRIKIFNHDLSVPIDQPLRNRLLQRTLVNGGVPIDYIINIASDSAVERSINDPGQCWKNNCELIFNVLEFARVVKPKVFLQFSTDEVYGEAEPTQAHREWDVIMPSNPYCLLPNTNIITKKGLIKIKNFNPFVHTLLSNSRQKLVEAECTKKFEYDYDGDVYLISANGLKITVAEQHKFFRKETFYTELKSPRLWNDKLITKHPHQRVVEVAAKDLQVGDYVLTTRNIPVENNKAKNKSNALCRFLGYFVGDGYYDNGNRYVKLADQKIDYLEYYRELLKNYLGVSKKASTGNFGTVYKHSTKDCHYLQFASEDLRNIIDLTSKSKILRDVQPFNKENVANFLAGFFDAEGYCKYENKLLKIIDAFQKRKAHLEIIQFCLKKLGINSWIGKSFKTEFNETTKQDEVRTGYKIHITDGKSISRFIKFVPSLKIKNGSVSARPQHKNWNNSHCWARIRKIKVSHYKGKVYDLETPKYHNYVANHFVVHNSASKAAQEALAISYWRTYDVPLLLLNVMNIIGERQDTEKFLPKLIYKIATGKSMEIYGEPGKIGSRYYVHGKNIADAIVFLIKNKPAMYEDGVKRPDRYNVVGDMEMDNLAVAQFVADCMGKILDYRLIPAEKARKGYDKRYALDGSKLAAMGWKHPSSTLESIRTIVQWTLEHPHWIL
jgi:dTDP-D-glucose 4,6-dehydratase